MFFSLSHEWKEDEVVHESLIHLCYCHTTEKKKRNNNTGPIKTRESLFIQSLTFLDHQLQKQTIKAQLRQNTLPGVT